MVDAADEAGVEFSGEGSEEKMFDKHVVRVPLDVAPPIATDRPCALGEVCECTMSDERADRRDDLQISLSE